MLPRVAPIATRMPISRRRSATMNDSTPYVPRTASSSASPANAPSSCARSLGRPIDSSNTASISRKPDDRDRGVDGADRLLQCRREHGHWKVRAQDDVHGRRSVGDPALRAVDRRPGLIDEQIQLGARVPIDAGFLDVLRHADHRVPRIDARPNRRAQIRTHALPDRIAPLPQPVGQRFIDDGDAASAMPCRWRRSRDQPRSGSPSS